MRVESSVIIAGFGGQGILFAGQILARAAMEEGREVLWIPSYGPEMRGGTASCTVILGDQPIGSPIVDHPSALIALNPPSLAKYGPWVVPGGVVVVNESLVGTSAGRTDVDEVRVPCTRLAAAAGDHRVVSVVALGAYVARARVVEAASVHQALRDLLGARRPQVLAVDLAAFDAGWAAVSDAVPDGRM
jgi:2-oxoglutarate ferredoxin oxidoreductase subunit gamma